MTQFAISGLTLKYGRNNVLKIPRWRFDGPAFISLLGSNGAGKSTLLELLAGLMKPTAGTITLDGVNTSARVAWSRVSYVPDRPVLFNDLSIADSMSYAARLAGRSQPDDRADQLVDGFDLEPLLNRFPSQLSRGQRQKASIVVAASQPAEVMLLDEPTIALDADARQALGQALCSWADSRLIIVATHDPELTDVCTDSVWIKDGQLTDPDADLESES